VNQAFKSLMQMGLKKVDGAPLGVSRLSESLDASRGCGGFRGLMQYLGLTSSVNRKT
jgi:hypothetical protein